MEDNFIMRLAILGPGLILGVILHEIGHGYMALKWGDSTAHDSGRITLNPIPHVDPMMTVVVPALCLAMGGFIFGGAKPVPINPNRFRNYHKGLFWVALAGPATNIVVGLLAAFLYAAVERFFPQPINPHSQGISFKAALMMIFYYTVMINYVLAIFNLLPLPPLDGSRILESILPTETYEKIAVIEPYSFFILIGLIMMGFFHYLFIPVQFLHGLTLGVFRLAFGLGGL